MPDVSDLVVEETYSIAWSELNMLALCIICQGRMVMCSESLAQYGTIVSRGMKNLLRSCETCLGHSSLMSSATGICCFTWLGRAISPNSRGT